MIYFISDLHFGHANCAMRYRGFSSVEEMNELLIQNWNAKVTEDDTVYILGDFSFRSGIAPLAYAKQLKGRKILIRGNHDSSWVKSCSPDKFAACFEDYRDYCTVKIGKTRCVLFHYPIANWDGCGKGTIHIYGHLHDGRHRLEAWKYMRNRPDAYNASAEVVNYTPATLEELIVCNREFIAQMGNQMIENEFEQDIE